MIKPLNLTDTQRSSCKVDYDVNRFYVCTIDSDTPSTAATVLLCAVYTKEELKSVLLQNKIVGATFSAMARIRYANPL